MEKIKKIHKTLRTHWKKSAFGVVALYYGAIAAKKRYEINLLMTAACKEAAKYGNCDIPIDREHRTISIILNPAANKRSARQEFEKYCEPLFHLAGIAIDIIPTKHEGHAKEIVESLKGTEAIIVAGGDGTLSETVTGLLRRHDEANRFPIGVLPLGKTNEFANNLFQPGIGVDRVRQIINASMAVIKESTVQRDVMKIERIDEENDSGSRPIYALGAIEWGAFRDAENIKDKYWYYGSLRSYASYVFNGYKDALNWLCKGHTKYSPPCVGCSNCVEKKPEPKTTWSFFMPSSTQNKTEYLNNINPECKQLNELCFKSTEVRLSTENVEKECFPKPSLKFALGKNGYSYSEFVKEGWRRIETGKREFINVIPVRTIDILPESDCYNKHLSIDNEEFEVKPIRVTLLPKVIKVYSNNSESK